MRRPFLILSVLAAIGIGWATYATVQELRDFRARPTRAVVEKYLSSWLPHHALGRAVVLHPGSFYFNSDLVGWVHHTEPPDNAWNRWLLIRLLGRLSPDDLRQRLPGYPFEPAPALIPLCLRAMDSAGLPPPDEREWEDEQRVEVLDLLQRVPGALEQIDLWIASEIEEPRDTTLLGLVLPSLARNDLVDWPGLVDEFWPDLDLSAATYAIGGGVQGPTPHALAFFDVLERRAHSHPPMAEDLLTFLGPYLAIDATRDRARQLLVHAVEGYPEYDPDFEGFSSDISLYGLFEATRSEIHPQISQTLFHASKPIRDDVAASAFHQLVHDDIGAAETLAASFFDEGDSTLRKAAIVLLIRHGSQTSGRWMDDAFTGEAPRRTYFSGELEYIYGSRATDLYVEIAGHDYLGDGKAWPPASQVTPEKTERWKEFIDRYPWHPGADDATYHRLFGLMREGHFDRVYAEAEAHFRRERPDRDADPYISFLLRESALAAPARSGEPPLARHLRTLSATSVAELTLAPRARLVAWRAALEWARAEGWRLDAAGISESNAEAMGQAARVASSPPGTRIDRWSAIDDLRAHNLYPVLYSLHFQPNGEPSLQLGSRQAQVAQEGARVMARLINDELGYAQLRGDEDLRRAVTLWILRHGDDEADARIVANELRQPFSYFAEWDLERLPWTLQRQVRVIQRLLTPDVAAP